MNERTLKSRRVFDGRLIKVDLVDVALDSVRRSKREIIRHPGAVAVLGRLPDDRFVFVRQFRKAIEQELLEVVAGTRDVEETPEACAIREMREETGYEVKTLSHMGYLHMAPGFCDERIDLFLADLCAGPGQQMSDDDESLDVVLLSRNEIEGMMARKEIHDGKTVAAWLMMRQETLTPE